MGLNILAIFCLVFIPGSKSAETCGGIVEGSGGRFGLKNVEEGSNCIWIIKSLSGNSINLMLERLGEGLMVNLYPQFNHLDPSLQPITLTSLNQSTVVETSGQTVVFIVTRPVTSAEGFSFFWYTGSPTSPTLVGSNYVEAQEGLYYLEKLSEQQHYTFILNAATAAQDRKVNIQANVKFDSCDLPNPCHCSFFGLYEVSPSGHLSQISSVCGRSMNFGTENLAPQLISFVSMGSTVGSEDSVQIEWQMRDQVDPVTSTQSTPIYSTTESCPPKMTQFSSTPSNDFICPDAVEILPCTCKISDSASSDVTCSGRFITQETIDHVMTLVKAANGDQVNMSYVHIRSTALTQLDLTPLLGFELDVLYIIDNLQLSTLLLPPPKMAGDCDPWPMIKTNVLDLSNNSLTNEGLGSTLKVIDPSVYYISLTENKITGGQYSIDDGSDIEFLPGLGSLTLLQQLYLSNNQINYLGGGQFKRNAHLESLYLSSNQIDTLDKNSFLFDPPAQNYNETLTIRLDFAFLTDEDVHPSHGLNLIDRNVNLYFEQGQFVYISQLNFQSFLKKDETSIINFRQNRFICDSKMKWLKDGRALYEKRVFYLDCVNDPGKTVFTTSKIH